MTKRALCLFAAVLLLYLPARAEEAVESILSRTDFSKVEEAVPEWNAGEILHTLATGGDVSQIWDKLKDEAKLVFSETLSSLAALFAPVVLSAVFRHFSADGGGKSRVFAALGQICYMVCAAGLIGRFFVLRETAAALIGRVARLTDAVFPVLTGLLTLAGSGNGAVMLTPLGALAGGLFSDVLDGILMRLVTLSAVVAAISNFSPGLRFEKLLSLIRSVVNWGAGVLTTGFLGAVAMKSLLAGSYDSAAVRTARYAVDNLLPVIGGEVAGTMDALVSSVLLVKNAAGVTGAILLLLICFKPLLTIFLSMTALRLASAAIEPMGDEPLSKLTENFSQVAGLMLVVCAASAVVLIMLTGGVFSVGGKAGG